MRKMAIPFFMAVLIHTAGVVCAGRMLVGYILAGSVVPAFQQGESSLEFTLLSSELKQEAPQPVVPLPQPAVHIENPVPEAVSEIVPVSTNEQVQPDLEGISALAPITQEVAAQGPDRQGENANADDLKKGVEGGAVPASVIRPVYPIGSRLRGEEGSVVMSVKVDVAGEVSGVMVIASSGYSGLDNAAEKAVKRTRFIPAQSDGKPREAEARLTVRFRLVD
ncbi:MAG: energy transducer TonB [bacterium]